MIIYIKTKSSAGHIVELHIAPVIATNTAHNAVFKKHLPGGGIQVIRDVLLGESHVAAYMSEFFCVSFIPLRVKDEIINSRIKELYNDSGI
jgi:hypothetical protein